MSEYTNQERASDQANHVAQQLSRAGAWIAGFLVLGGIIAVLVAIVGFLDRNGDGELRYPAMIGWGLATALVQFLAGWWIRAFSDAIAHLVKPRF